MKKSLIAFTAIVTAIASIAMLSGMSAQAASQSKESINTEAAKLAKLLNGRWIQCEEGKLTTDNFIVGINRKTKAAEFVANDGTSFTLMQISVGENVILTVGLEGAEEDGRDVLIFSSEALEGNDVTVDQLSYDENVPGNYPSKFKKASCKIGKI